MVALMIKIIIKIIFAVLLFFFPTFVIAWLFRIFGFHIGLGSRVGFSFIFFDQLHLGNSSRIGHLNFINVRRLLLGRSSRIGRSNLFYGNFSLYLKTKASIGNRNKIYRSQLRSVVCWSSSFVVGENSIVTSDHLIDVTRSITMKSHSIIAGNGSQLWTHGYIHSQKGPDRYRLDGKITIGNNVYLGSRCILNLGVKIVDGCTVGSGSVVSKSLTTPALYVGASLRCLPLPIDPSSRPDLEQQMYVSLCEKVFLKN
jgi:acetyltransferase-like isoleucine patch superfamily enzyme